MRDFLNIAETLSMNPVDLDDFISDYYNTNLSLEDNVKNLIMFSARCTE